MGAWDGGTDDGRGPRGSAVGDASPRGRPARQFELAAEEVDALVVGGGPAGLRAAEALAAAGRRVVVAERMPTPGRKLLMAGRSGLNLTREEAAPAMAPAFGAAWGRLAPIVAETDAAAVGAWARGLGQPLFTGSTGRVFPEAMKASPLLRAWRARLAAGGVEVRTRWRWTGVAGIGTAGGAASDRARKGGPGGAIAEAHADEVRIAAAPDVAVVGRSEDGEPARGDAADASRPRGPARSDPSKVPPPRGPMRGEPPEARPAAALRRGGAAGAPAPISDPPALGTARAAVPSIRGEPSPRPAPSDAGLFLFDTPEGPRAIRPAVAVLALGGASWRRLGSDGAWAAALAASGVPVAPFAPSNAGLAVRWSEPMARHFGSPLKGVALRAGGRASRGEVVVSARGLEGGGLYPLTPAIREGAPLVIDLAPDRDEATVSAALARVPAKVSLANRLRRALGPSPVKAALLREWGDPSAPLAARIKALAVRHEGLRPMDEAISTAGGVAWKGLDEGLMLRARPGVFACGEMLDWEAPTGGYLMTACLATGAWAGRHAAEWREGCG